jgi:hypothetical protein
MPPMHGMQQVRQHVVGCTMPSAGHQECVQVGCLSAIAISGRADQLAKAISAMEMVLGIGSVIGSALGTPTYTKART